MLVKERKKECYQVWSILVKERKNVIKFDQYWLNKERKNVIKFDQYWLPWGLCRTHPEPNSWSVSSWTRRRFHVPAHLETHQSHASTPPQSCCSQCQSAVGYRRQKICNKSVKLQTAQVLKKYDAHAANTTTEWNTTIHSNWISHSSIISIFHLCAS